MALLPQRIVLKKDHERFHLRSDNLRSWWDHKSRDMDRFKQSPKIGTLDFIVVKKFLIDLTR